ncbi:hypothetical protein JW898_03460 [Candidatus Woesearchaeota archaeon]|nr:hypothetical protein [Candidatus Woesearchaeota archaeon]
MSCYQWTTANIISWIQTAVLVVAAWLAIANARHFHSKKRGSEIMHVKKHVFTWLSVGVVSMAIAYLIQNILLVSRSYAKINVADVFFVLSFASLAIGFNYFWYMTSKMHKLHIKEPVFIFSVMCGVFIWLYYLFVMAIIPNSEGYPLTVRALYYFYPVIVSLIFLFTLVVHPRMKAGVIRTPIWYISNGVFTYFIAYMIQMYDRWTAGAHSLTTIYAVLFLISACYFALGFYAARKKYR